MKEFITLVIGYIKGSWSGDIEVKEDAKEYPSGGIVSKQDEYIIPPNPNFDCKKTIFDLNTNNNE